MIDRNEPQQPIVLFLRVRNPVDSDVGVSQRSTLNGFLLCSHHIAFGFNDQDRVWIVRTSLNESVQVIPVIESSITQNGITKFNAVG